MAKSKSTTPKNDLAVDWMGKIKAGIEFRKKYSTFDKWEKFRKMYRSQWDPSIVPVNKVFSYGRMMIPKVYFRNPRVCVTALKPELVWHAKVVEALDNMLIKQVMLKDTLKQAVTDTFLCGISPIKLGFDSEFGYMPEQAITGDGETATQESQKKDEGKIEYNTAVRPGSPWASRVLPEHIIVPWGAKDANSLPWIANYIVRPLDDVKSDQKYMNTKDLEGTRQPNKDMPKSTKSSVWDKDMKYAELYEIRDIKTGMMLTICEEQILLSTRDVLQDYGLPYEFMVFNHDPEFFWPIPDVVMLEPQQEELNDTRTQASKHRKIALVKFLFKKGAISKVEQEKFLSGEVGPGVEIDGDDSPAAAVHALQPHIPPELYTEAKAILQDMQESVGYGPNQTGQFSPYHNKTAKESAIVEASFEDRVDERKDIVADLLERIVHKFNQMIFRFWTEEKVVNIVAPQGTPFWIKYTGDELKGDYMLSIDPESGIPINRMLKYQMSKELFGMFNGDQLVDQQLLRRMVLSHYAQVDPLADQLLNQMPMPGTGGAQGMAAMRQPGPVYPQGGGGSSPENPAQLGDLTGAK